MNVRRAILGLCALLAPHAASAHGPQLQVTLDGASTGGGRIVTRELLLDGPYSGHLTAPKSVYVMPLGATAGVWYSRPNGSVLPGGLPKFNSGPGLAYGYGYDAASNPQPFPAGSQFAITFTAGLKSWNGAAFADAGAAEAEIFRGSAAAPSALARTNDAAPLAGIAFPPAGVSFAADGGETHTSVSYRMLGDGASTTSSLADGVYLLSFQLSSSAPSVQPSDPYFFVLSKNGAPAAVEAAAASLGFPAAAVQNLLVPEPSLAALAATASLGLVNPSRRRRAAHQRNRGA
ncbi:MAG TPA: hypothetical protein VEQ85_02425 [Lacipirellulaceae bacterium]|nr:hypothetical protein [Lacipirellulaceae bacterium]